MLINYLLILLLSNGLTTRFDTSILFTRITLGALMYVILITIDNLYINYIQDGIGIYGGIFSITSTTLVFHTYMFIICSIILSITSYYPRKKVEENNLNLLNLIKEKTKKYAKLVGKLTKQYSIIEYALIIIFASLGGFLLIASNDFASIYLCLELQSFSLYIISAIHRDSESSTESALTYFLLGGLSSCFILLGIILIYSNMGMTNTNNIYILASSSYTGGFLIYCFVLIAAGLFFKIAAAPYHWWSPDVYDGVPTTVTTFIAIFAKISILLIIFELTHNIFISTLDSIFSTEGYGWKFNLSLTCFFSLVIGSVLGLSQNRIKKLLAYSTISHIGFILLALSIRNQEAYQAFFFYTMQYLITNLNAFIILLGMGFSLYLYSSNVIENNKLTEKSNSPIQLINQIKGYFSINPMLTLCFAITIFSFIGLPPLVGFFGKQMVLSAALDNNATFLVLTGIITSVIGASYYLGLIKTTYFDKSDYKKSYLYIETSLSANISIAISILSLSILLFIFLPLEIISLNILITNYTIN